MKGRPFWPKRGRPGSFEDDSFDIITFGGSLFYAKSQDLLDEVLRICTGEGSILVYDFEMLYEESLVGFDLIPTSYQSEKYDHQVNFSGLLTKGLQLKKSIDHRTILELNTTDLAHVLLSMKTNYQALRNKLGPEGLLRKVAERLDHIATDHKLSVSANLFGTAYTCVKNG